MSESDAHSEPDPSETLRGGPARAPLLEGVQARWRLPVVAVLAFALGAGGAGALIVGLPAPSPPTQNPSGESGSFDEHDVELILFQASRARPRGGRSASRGRAVHLESAVFLSGGLTSTLLTIEALEPSLDIRASALPVTISPSNRYQLIVLEIIVRDCAAATQWTPSDRPFFITWRDELEKEHLDRAGEFNRTTATSLTRQVETTCRTPIRQRPTG